MLKDKCHFIGVGGIGMSGLARILLSKNKYVTGSDAAANSVTESLAMAGAKIYRSHSPHNISPDCTVIYSSAIKSDNPEFTAAKNMKCHLIHRSELLALLLNDSTGLVATGTHGKTTTTALLIAALNEARLSPSFSVGGILCDMEVNAAHGSGEYFVAEADESDGSFLKYHPFGAIITNIDFDHMDYYENEKKLLEAFTTFASQVISKRHLLWCGDDPLLRKINCPGISYGFGDSCNLRLSNFRQDKWKIIFDIAFEGKKYLDITAPMIGIHNALNAAAVFGLALQLNIAEDVIRSALKKFKGTQRRSERKAEIHNVLLIDDYGHHPTEIRATLQAVRSAIDERRLVAVFQPHRYTRTRDCKGLFGKIFDDADEVIVTDIYAADESPLEGVSHNDILQEIRASSTLPCRYVPRKQIADVISLEARPHDVIITIGAGDITKLSGDIIAQLKLRPPKKIKVGVVFGGPSVEHEVSLMSAQYICHSLKKEIYDIQPIGITKNGKWICRDDALKVLNEMAQHPAKNKIEPCSALNQEVLDKIENCDILFPILHGTLGEDGRIQGFFDTLGKAYVGCDHRSSAVSMDKVLAKKLVMAEGVLSAPFVSITKKQWQQNRAEVIAKILELSPFPQFVKPAHLGSSIGVAKVESTKNLEVAIDNGFKVDSLLLVEKGLNIREIEFAVFGDESPVVFPPGEVHMKGKVYDYATKYSDDAPVTPTTTLPPHLVQKGMEIAKKTYLALGCNGLARVDFFLEGENFWFNEINPIPGFTQASMFPKICEVNNLSGPELIDRLINLGLRLKRRQQQIVV